MAKTDVPAPTTSQAIADFGVDTEQYSLRAALRAYLLRLRGGELGAMPAILGFVVLFAGVIFFSTLLNSSLVGLAERRREVATFRVLGYNEWQVGALFLRGARRRPDAVVPGSTREDRS